MKILLTGGGSGGHIYPLLAVAEKLKKAAMRMPGGIELYYMGAPGIFKNLLENSGIEVIEIISAKRRRYFDPRNIIDIPKFFLSIIQAYWKVFWIMPDALFSKGGTGSAPVVLACSFYRVPIMIHESDSIPGYSNLIASKHADRIGIGFETAQEFFVDNFKKDKDKIKVINKIALVGNPVREFLINIGGIDQVTAKKSFGFDSQKPLLLVLGGSQGAVRINDFILNSLEELIGKGYQVLHQTGIRNIENVKLEMGAVLKKIPETQITAYDAVPYFEENIKDALVAADLVISRAGSGSIFEIATVGKPSILLPIPKEVVGDHQIKNAFEYSRSGAAVMIEEANLRPHLFINEVEKIFSNPNLLKNMSEAAKKFAKPQAAQTIADEIMNLATRN